MRNNYRVLIFAATVTVLQLATAAQSGASLVYAAEMDGSSYEIMESPTYGSDEAAADQYIALIAEAAQQATVGNPVFPSLLMAYSIHYTEMGTVLGAQEGNYLPSSGQLGTQTIADDFRIFSENFYLASKDELDKSADFATQAALLEAYTGEVGVTQKLIDMTTQYNLSGYDNTAIEDNAIDKAVVSENEPSGDTITISASDFTFSETVPVQEPASIAVNFQATIYKIGFSIDSLPWGVAGYQYLAASNDYMGAIVRVTKESLDHAYGYIEYNGAGLGWIDLKALKLSDRKVVAYSSYLTSSSYSIDTLPWGESGYAFVGYTSNHLGKRLDITFESSDGNYLYASADGKSLGWIDKHAFGLYGETKTSFLSGPYSIDTLPWGTPGYSFVGYTNEYVGTEVTVKGTTQNGLYALISLDGKDLGWVDKRALSNLKSKPVNYSAYITSGSYSFDSLPWGEPGYTLLGYTSAHLGKMVDVLYETLDGNYKYVSSNGKGIGWIDKRAFGLYGSEYVGYVQAGSYSIDSLPWGTQGYIYIAASKDYAGLELTVKGSTQNGQYLLVASDGKDLGWIDKRAIKQLNFQTVSYKMYISGAVYGIDSLPWGEYGFRNLGITSTYIGTEVTISKKSSDGNYLYASLNGKGLGWIDKRAFGFVAPGYAWYITNSSASITNFPVGTVGSTQVATGNAYFGKMLDVIGQTPDGSQLWVSFKGQSIGWIRSDAGCILNHTQPLYTKTIQNAGYSIDSLPWGTAGYYWISSSGDYLGKTATISKLSVDGAYAYITVDGNALGWIDTRAFAMSRVVYLDPGHGGYESGASYSGVQEKTINLEIANEVRTYLEKLGMTVIMSRTYDEYISLLNRSADVNESNAQIFVSIHHNAMPGSTTANGIETYYYEYYEEYPSLINQAMHNDPTRVLESAKLAEAIHNTLIARTGATNRGIQRDTFSVLRETDVPAVLLELGFMSSPTELAKLTNDSYQTIMAKAISDGIVAYFK